MATNVRGDLATDAPQPLVAVPAHALREQALPAAPPCQGHYTGERSGFRRVSSRQSGRQPIGILAFYVQLRTHLPSLGRTILNPKGRTSHSAAKSHTSSFGLGKAEAGERAVLCLLVSRRAEGDFARDRHRSRS